MPLLKLVKPDTDIKFVEKRRLSFGLSIAVIFACLLQLFTVGLNFGIDFTGGTLIEIKTDGPANIADLRSRFSGLELGSVSIQEFGAEDEVLIRVPQQDDAGEQSQVELLNTIKSAIDDVVIEYRRVEYVGPQVGKELIEAGAKAVFFSLIGIMLYIWVRFEWPFGIAAVSALIHDTILTLGFFAFTQIEFGLATVAAVLMVAGYSINDTVVVFDRVRENLRKFKRRPLGDVFNLSINQMLGRTLMTSITTLLALLALWFFGGEVLSAFIAALIVGILIGTYSSVFIATPLLLYINRDALRPELEEVPA
jgi:preprotein translocase SecF subunit